MICLCFSIVGHDLELINKSKNLVEAFQLGLLLHRRSVREMKWIGIDDNQLIAMHCMNIKFIYTNWFL